MGISRPRIAIVRASLREGMAKEQRVVGVSTMLREEDTFGIRRLLFRSVRMQCQIDDRRETNITCSDTLFSHDKFTSAMLALGFGKSNDVGGGERRIILLIITRLGIQHGHLPSEL